MKSFNDLQEIIPYTHFTLTNWPSPEDDHTKFTDMWCIKIMYKVTYCGSALCHTFILLLVIVLSGEPQ